MEEMCQDLGMPGYVKKAGRLIRSVEAVHISLARKELVQDRQQQSLNVG